ncbi:MAG: Hpt domain-containing protein, partial [Beijerinckiaceae bacterium]
MSHFRNNTASRPDEVRAEKKKDHTLLHPPTALKQKAYVVMRTGDASVEQTIAHGETALDEVAGNFQNWMSSETDRLAEARAGFNENRTSEEKREALFQAAHTVRGNAGVFGFPLAGRVADSLSKLLDRCPPGKIPDALVDQHVDAVRAMVRENARGTGNPKARELAVRLLEVTNEYLDFVAPEP